MAANPSSFRKNQANFPDPPKRGKVTAHIFKGLANSVASSVSKAVGKLTTGSRAGCGDGGSASSTPPTSAYNSDTS